MSTKPSERRERAKELRLAKLCKGMGRVEYNMFKSPEYNERRRLAELRREEREREDL